jgi:hypothetical protein
MERNRPIALPLKLSPLFDVTSDTIAGLKWAPLIKATKTKHVGFKNHMLWPQFSEHDRYIDTKLP